MTSDLPIEVVTTILSNLDQTDLLSCRLVNQSWNHESLLVFRKSSFRTHLNIRQDGGNAEKYIEFVATQNPQLVLPIHLFLKGFLLPHPKTVEIVTSLQRMCGPDSIQSLTLHICCRVEDDYKTLMILLSKISHALKTINVEYDSVSCSEPFVLDLMKDLSFPNVASLKYLYFLNYGRLSSYRRQMLVQAQFILICPNLKQLCIQSESTEVTLPPTLQSFAVETLTDPQKFRNNILECSRLHTLKIYKYESGDREIIVSILESLGKTLKSLTIGVHTETMIQFPGLPYLESLRLRHMKQDFWCFRTVGLNCDDMNLNSETFPSLKLVRLPFIFSLRNGSPLPSVNTLIFLVLAIDRNPYINSDFSMQEYFKDLTRMFPNARTVALKEGFPAADILHSGCQNKFLCKTVLKELITSELAPQINQIQIEGVPTDILGEILVQNRILPQPQIMMTYFGQKNNEAEDLIQEAFGLLTGEFGIKGIQSNDEGAGSGRRVMFSEGCNSGHKMTNVKKIKLVFGSFYAEEKFLDLQLNLMSIAKCLPSLTDIELIGIQWELYLKEFDSLAIVYPNLLLRITKLGPKIQYDK